MPNQVGAGERLRAMLEARSVALVGASNRRLSVGRVMVSQLLRGGFQGAVYPVNPRYAEVEGLPCHPSLSRVPERVDLAVLAVPNAALEGELRAAAEAGAGSAAIFGSAHGEAADGTPLADRLARLARDAGMGLCGPGGMGFCSLEQRLRIVGFYQPVARRSGPVTLVSHSGSVFSALLHNDRDLEFNLAVSPGQELVTTTSDYLRYALTLESTRVIALFLETVRDPEAFQVALREAVERDVPVVALKVGRAPRASDLVRAHSGALAGDDGAFEALFDAHGVQRVGTLDELADAVELLAAGRRAPRGGLAALHDSGGERAHLVDLAEDVGVPLAEVGPATVTRLTETLEPGLPPTNPLDAWGTGNDFERIYAECAQALHDDDATAAVCLVVDLTPEEDDAYSYLALARRIRAATRKPFAVMSNLSSAIDREVAARLRADGIPVLEGTATGLAAFRALLAYRDFRQRAPIAPPPSPAAQVRERWTARLDAGQPLGEAEALELLADYGIPVAPCEPVSDAAAAVAAAERLGWPVALKTATPGILHKSDVGGVIVDIPGPEPLRAAYADVAGRLGPHAIVQPMTAAGVELTVGLTTDPQFGHLLVVGAGGALVELLADRRLALPPIDERRARELLDGLSVRRLLEGYRGAPPAEIGALARAVAAVSVIASDLGPRLDALDVNPLTAGPSGCVAVDAVVVGRADRIAGEDAPSGEGSESQVR